ncbi:chemotaxis protein CheB [Nodosilinea sp. PGN35]|uniref:chemotaxis protein CheB n=1 Tax=Nodosilinea sp. PGN35 TaxID=3020489 RepID=UPI0023B33488|nr:chemotaxis protein CheB [Nodosilinea sp. TSF1-S3]MDF0370108.1 chemotaxis protein CheB [Nodosilinea sp. TSF1-S3]
MDLGPLVRTDAPFPIVGIVASAGGLEAFTALISHLPTDTGMAFVLIQHLAPDHESMLPEILSRVTEMPVGQVREEMAVEPNQIYVIPPNSQMLLEDSVFHLAPRQKIQGRYLPGDVFFQSLAANWGNKAIAVVLSGMDADGSQGIKAVKAAGGVTFAQCEATARFDSMPNTAVATGRVDFVLPPQAIAAELIAVGRRLLRSDPEPLQLVQASPAAEDALTTIFALLRTTTGVDFTLYKPTTVERRMQRRMLLYKLETLEGYAQYLQAHPAEVQALYEEILIHVTSFFRDPETFEQLKAEVFPIISRTKTASTPLRIWVAGCSTGEEVYSIAMGLVEFFSDRATVPPIQIFATDISEAALNKARAGFYLENQLEGVSPERLNRFFVAVSGGYQICGSLRELCVFARHNLGGDPPFSNLDLISCRNLLIYLSDQLQERIMSLFHYSLNATGFLMLGTSESVKAASELFSLVHEPARIYARQSTLTRPLFSFSPQAYPPVGSESQRRVVETIANNFDLAREVDQLISNRYAPVSVVVNDQMHILHVRGDTDSYLRLAPGTTDLNLLLMAREGLAMPLRTAIYQAQAQNTSIRQEQIELEVSERESASTPRSSPCLNLEVIPFEPTIGHGQYFLVIFEAVSPLVTPRASPTDERQLPETSEQEILQLRQALAASTQRELSAQAHLQAVIQEHNYLNENLRVANEEILSSNEELQRTNEELQTAKEEIQATNEELATTNEELRHRNLKQSRDNSDLINFIDSISVPILMLTNDLRIRRFTPTAQRLFNFISTDVGRPFSDFRTEFEVSSLEAMAQEVLETLNTQSREIQTQTGYWYSLRIRPYRTTENQIDGVTMVFLDIDALKRHGAVLESARNYAEAIVDTVQTPLAVLDAELQVNRVNRAFFAMFQGSGAEAEELSLAELSRELWTIPHLRSLLREVLLDDRHLQDVEVEHRFEQIGEKTMLLNACKLHREDEADMILLAIADITERKQFEVEQLARQLAEDANRIKDEFLSNLSHELRNPLNAMLGWAQMLRSRTLDDETAARALEVIERNARAQSRLVEDILDTSRIVSGKLNLNSCPLDLRPVVEAAIETVQIAADAHSIQIVPRLSSQTIVGDASRLQQVVWNLLSNAIKFTPPHGRIDVTLEQVQGEAQIQVTDTGQGISADLLPHIFDRFWQGDSSTTKAKPGLGLGLSIVRHLVELHGGTVAVASPGDGQGATFIVRLPLHDSAPQPPPTASPASPASLDLTAFEPASDSSLSLAGWQILVVDDEADTCELVEFLLQQCGAEVQIATSARAALAALSQEPRRFNLLICDIGMPEADGYWLIQQVRSLHSEEESHVPAIALTAYSTRADQQRAIAAGFQHHLAKPVDVEELVRVIRSLPVV